MNELHSGNFQHLTILFLLRFFWHFFFNFKTSKPFHSKFGNLSLSVDRIVFGVFHFSE